MQVTFCSKKCYKRYKRATKKKYGCWKYKLLKPFTKKGYVVYCCVGCKWAKKNRCAKWKEGE